jgi:hypothetical protein
MSSDTLNPVKPHPSFNGYSAFVINNLVVSKGITPAEVVAWIVDRWIDGNRKFLEEEFSISRDRYKAESSKTAAVLQHPAARTPESG